MIAHSEPRRFPRGLRRALFFGMAFLVVVPRAGAGTKEERDAARGVFLAEENIVAQCVYRPKPEDVVWGALAGLARDLGPDYARFFPPKRSGSFDEARDAYWLALLALEDERNIPLKALVARSIRAYCRSIDRHSDYDDYETWAKVHETFKFNNASIGVTLSEWKGEDFILLPFRDGPGERAGIVNGDVLMEVNGTSVRGMSKLEVLAMCAGKEGSRVTLKVRHADGTEESIAVMHEQAVASPLAVEQTTSGIRVTCHQIFDQAAEDFRKLLASLRAGQDLTIDFRGCSIGSVPAAVKMASLFLPAETVVCKLETAKGQEKLISPNKTPYRPSKLTILQDRFTASSAELVIAALVGNRGLHVETRGERTFGKGVTVMQVEIAADASGRTAGILLITDTRIYGPNNEVWDGEGLPPTVKKK